LNLLLGDCRIGPPRWPPAQQPPEGAIFPCFFSTDVELVRMTVAHGGVISWGGRVEEWCSSREGREGARGMEK
jgi:hypothetical protein